VKPLLILIGILVISCNSNDHQSTDTIPTEIAQKDRKSISKELQNGDLIFHTSQSSQSQAIQIATNSKYSHMGIIYKDGKEYFVYEAIQPVQITKLDDWINRGRFGDFDLSNNTVQNKVKERYGNEIPKDELVITPDRIV